MAEPSVAQLFLDSTAKSIATAQANNGMGGLGDFPPDGEYNVRVLKIILGETTFRTKTGDVPAGKIQFQYEEVTASPGRSAPREFFGSPFIFPKDASQVTDAGNKTRINIDMERLQGHLSVINGSPCTDIRQGLQAAIDKVNSVATEVVLRATSRPNPKNAANPYRTEFLTANLSQATA